MSRFTEALSRGDVATALVNAPFGYHSRLVPGGFRFTIESGSLAGRVGEADSLLGAVLKAVSVPSTTGGTTT
jgi:hypothetical protein